MALVGILSLFLYTGCEGRNTFRNSVPVYPVRVVIDTRTLFVHFTPTAFNSYITVDQEGYKENGKFILPVSAMDQWGYGGVVVYVSMRDYTAYDLACPYCAGRGFKSPCTMDGMYAICPTCGEQYEMSSGYAVPQKGISHEPLRELNIIKSDGKLTISQKQ